MLNSIQIDSQDGDTKGNLLQTKVYTKTLKRLMVRIIKMGLVLLLSAICSEIIQMYTDLRSNTSKAIYVRHLTVTEEYSMMSITHNSSE